MLTLNVTNIQGNSLVLILPKYQTNSAHLMSLEGGEKLFKIGEQENIFEQDEDDDILNDVRNLYIQENDVGAEEEENFQAFNKGTDIIEGPAKPVEKEERVIFEAPPSTNIPENKVIQSAPKDKEPTPQKSDPKCKSNTDCVEDFYCLVKSGKCTEKIDIDKTGCSDDDQCSGKTSVCFSKTCRSLCNTESSAKVCDVAAGLGCVEVKGLKTLKSFNGICDKIKAQSKPISADKSKSSGNGSAVVGGVVLGVFLIAFIIGFVYLRGYLKRRNRNNNPDMFLFDRLQRSTSQSILNTQGSSKPMADRLNEKLSTLGGARFTRWAALSNDE